MTPAQAPTAVSLFQSPESKHVLGAYYPSWKIYKGSKPSDLRIPLLTHVYYAFARIKDDGTVYSLDEKADTQLAVDGTKGCLPAIKKLKYEQNSQLKIILTIGGGSGSAQYPSVAASSTKTAKFCQSALDMVNRFGLDGVDIDWEHPKTAEDGKLFESLLRGLRQSFPSTRYSLTAALPAGEWCLRNIDLPSLLNVSTPKPHSVPILDHLNTMAYDFAGPWTEGQSGHQAQLYTPSKPHNAFAERSVDAITQYLVDSRGVDPKRIIIGIPVYGRSFLGVNGPSQKFSACGGDGDGTFQYKDLPRRGAREHIDKTVGAASCYGGEDGGWISYDNSETVHMKAEYVKKHGLGGIFFWTGSADSVTDERSLVVAGYRALNADDH